MVKSLKKYLKLNSLVSISTIVVFLTTIHLCRFQSKDIASDPGTGWHLKTGKLISETLTIPKVDPFLSGERTWISDQWLGDVVLWIVYSLGSWELLYSFITALFLLTFFFICSKIQKSYCSFTNILCLPPLLYALKISEIHYLVRPVVFGFPLFALTLLSLFKIANFIESDKVTDNIFSLTRRFFYLPLMFLVWANLHPSFVLGLIALSVLLPALIIDKRFTLLLPVFFLILACSIATLINPYFIDLHLSVISLGSNKFFMNFHQEWLPPRLSNTEGLFTEIMLLTIFIDLLIESNTKGIKTSFKSLCSGLLIAVFLHFGMSAVRMLPYLSIALIPQSSKAIISIYQRLKEYFVIRKLEKIPEWSYPSPNQIVIVAICIIILVLPQTGLKAFPEKYIGPSKNKFPYQGVEFLNNLKIKSETNIFVPPRWGGFITLYLSKKFKGIVDDRNTLVGEDKYRDMLKAQRSTKLLTEFMRKNKAKYALLPSSKYRIIHEGSNTSRLTKIFEDRVGTIVKLNKKGGNNISAITTEKST